MKLSRNDAPFFSPFAKQWISTDLVNTKTSSRRQNMSISDYGQWCMTREIKQSRKLFQREYFQKKLTESKFIKILRRVAWRGYFSTNGKGIINQISTWKRRRLWGQWCMMRQTFWSAFLWLEDLMEIVLQNNYHTPSILIQFLTRHSSAVNSVGLDPSRTNVTTMKQGRPLLHGKPSGKPAKYLRHCFREATGYRLEHNGREK